MLLYYLHNIRFFIFFWKKKHNFIIISKQTNEWIYQDYAIIIWEENKYSISILEIIYKHLKWLI